MNGIQALTTPMRPGSVGNTPKGAGPAVVPEPLKNLMGLVDFLTASAPAPQGQAAPPVAAQVAQAAAQKMGMGAPAVGDVVETAVPAMATKQMQDQAAMQRMAQQMAARSRPQAGITSLDPDIVPLKEGGIIGYAGPDGSLVGNREPFRPYAPMITERELLEQRRREKERKALEEERARNMALIASEGFTRPAMVDDPRLIRTVPQEGEQQVIGRTAPPPPPPREKRVGPGVVSAAPAAPTAPAAPEQDFLNVAGDILKKGIAAQAPTMETLEQRRRAANKAAGLPENYVAGTAMEQGIPTLRSAMQKVLDAGQMTPQEKAWEAFHRFAAGAQGAGTAGGALSGGTREVLGLEAGRRAAERGRATLEYDLEKLVVSMQKDIEAARKAEANGRIDDYNKAMDRYDSNYRQYVNLAGSLAGTQEAARSRHEATQARLQMAKEGAANRAAMAKKSPTDLAFDAALKKHKGDALAALQELQGITHPQKPEDIYKAYDNWKKESPQTAGMPPAQRVQLFLTERGLLSAPPEVRDALAKYGPK